MITRFGKLSTCFIVTFPVTELNKLSSVEELSSVGSIAICSSLCLSYFFVQEDKRQNEKSSAVIILNGLVLIFNFDLRRCLFHRTNQIYKILKQKRLAKCKAFFIFNRLQITSRPFSSPGVYDRSHPTTLYAYG